MVMRYQGSGTDTRIWRRGVSRNQTVDTSNFFVVLLYTEASAEFGDWTTVNRITICRPSFPAERKWTFCKEKRWVGLPQTGRNQQQRARCPVAAWEEEGCTRPALSRRQWNTLLGRSAEAWRWCTWEPSTISLLLTHSRKRDLSYRFGQSAREIC